MHFGHVPMTNSGILIKISILAVVNTLGFFSTPAYTAVGKNTASWLGDLERQQESEDLCARYLEASSAAVFSPELQRYLSKKFDGDKDQMLLQSLATYIGQVVSQGRAWSIKTEDVLAADVATFFSGQAFPKEIAQKRDPKKPWYESDTFSSATNADKIASDLASLELTFKNSKVARNERAGQLLEVRALMVKPSVLVNLQRLYSLYAQIQDYDENLNQAFAAYFSQFRDLVVATYYPGSVKANAYLGSAPEMDTQKLRLTLKSEQARIKLITSSLRAAVDEAAAIVGAASVWGFQSSFHKDSLKSVTKYSDMRAAFAQLPKTYTDLIDIRWIEELFRI